MIYITKDRFVWNDLTNQIKGLDDTELSELWLGLELYAVLDDDSDGLLDSIEGIREAIKLGFKVCIECGHLPKTKIWSPNVDRTVVGGYWYVKIKDLLAHVQI